MNIRQYEIEQFEKMNDVAESLISDIAKLTFGDYTYAGRMSYVHEEEGFQADVTDGGGCGGDRYVGEVYVPLDALEDPEAYLEKERQRLAGKK